MEYRELIMNTCQVCFNKSVKLILNLGPQPLCNRFVQVKNETEYFHPLILGQCCECGVMQIVSPVPDKEIVPHFKWLHYNEPEGHLDDLSEKICSLPGINSGSVACGITYKDDSLLKRIMDRIGKTWRVDPENDLSITTPGAGGETVQAHLTLNSSRSLISKHGLADIVIARHIYEHASNTKNVLEALKSLVTDNGYIIFEIPDCSKVLKNNDYSMLWEEHILYFTPSTFKNSLGYFGLEMVSYKKYSYPIENALVAIVRKVKSGSVNKKPLHEPNLTNELTLGTEYSTGFEKCKKSVKEATCRIKSQGKKVAVFGAGHLSCMFINLMELGKDIEFVVDDDPNKKGLYMPGSKLPIYGSDALINNEISLCLLSLSPDSEKKVIANNQQYLSGGGEFRSIFSSIDTNITNI